MDKFKIPRSSKLDFFYFILITIIVLAIFAAIFGSAYAGYWLRVFKMEKYYSGQTQSEQ